MKKRAGILIIALLCAGCNYPELSDDEIQELTGAGPTGTPNGGGTSSDVIKATVVNGTSYNSKVDEVRAMLGYDGYVIAKGKYANGGFTLNLPATVPEKYLEPLFDEVPEGITVSNIKAQFVAIYRIAAYNGEDEIGEFWCGYEDAEIVCHFIYADRDVKITGSFSEDYGDWPEQYNVSLKKGWNKVL